VLGFCGQRFSFRASQEILKAVLKRLAVERNGFLFAHALAQDFGYGDCAVFSLVVFEDCDDGSARS
jgi:hypothetical protein